jgi:drug/metabolite transporter (DMT)-like permease
MASCFAILSVVFPSLAISSMVLGQYTLSDRESRQFDYLDWVRAILLGIIGTFCGRTF